VIGSLQMLICDIFAAELAEPQQALPDGTGHIPQLAPNAQAGELISAVCLLIESEKEAVASSVLSVDEQEEALNILESLAAAVREGNAGLIKSLTCGYNYFIMQTRFVSESISPLFEAVGEYLGTL
ncbi:MAG: hypothetical protein K2O67_04760, partial [Clostridia bacterium]|nr:hypothetical protein [Clostridia bacterium]